MSHFSSYNLHWLFPTKLRTFCKCPITEIFRLQTTLAPSAPWTYGEALSNCAMTNTKACDALLNWPSMHLLSATWFSHLSTDTNSKGVLGCRVAYETIRQSLAGPPWYLLSFPTYRNTQQKWQGSSWPGGVYGATALSHADTSAPLVARDWVTWLSNSALLHAVQFQSPRVF